MGSLIKSIDQLNINARRTEFKTIMNDVATYNITENSENRRRGVSSDAHKNGYRLANLFNNYEGGRVYRINPMSTIDRNYTKYGFMYSLPLRDIGELVHLEDEVGNSRLNFTTQLDFNFINDTIRSYALNWNISNRYDEMYTKPTDYLTVDGKNDYESSRVPVGGQIGQEYELPDVSNCFLFSDRKFITQRYAYNGDNGYYKTVVAPFNSHFKDKFHDFTNQYGTGQNQEVPDVYTIGQGHTIVSEVQNQGSGMIDSLKESVMEYEYFAEDGYNGKFRDGDVYTSFGIHDVSYNGTKSPLLEKTRKLFADNKIHSLVNRFKTGIDAVDYELESSYSIYGLSRGRNLLKESPTNNGYENPYCRVWTAMHQYHRLKDLIRPFGDEEKFNNMFKTDLRPNGIDRLTNNSVLQKNGMPKIAPYKNGTEFDGDVKRYMFSIENLAWKDVSGGEKLSKEQKGKNGGRIMWFPPYNLKFTENVNVEWNANKFIGRGEQIYTYTNTDRSGTLSFTLLIDHPSVVNKWASARQRDDLSQNKDKYEQELLRFFAGCEPLTINPKDNPLYKDESNTKNESKLPSSEPNLYQQPFKKIAYIVFFPNNFTTRDYKDATEGYNKLSRYENGGGEGFTEIDDFTTDEIINGIDDGVNISRLNLNTSPSEDVEKLIRKTLFKGESAEKLEIRYLYNPAKGIAHLSDEITNNKLFGEDRNGIDDNGACIISNIKIMGNASSHGIESKNQELGKKRGEFIKEIAKKNCKLLSDYNIDSIKIENGIIPVNETTNEPNGTGGTGTRINSTEAKIGRNAYILFELSHSTQKDARVTPSAGGATAQGLNLSNGNTASTSNARAETMTKIEVKDEYHYDNEYLYFSELSRESPAVYKNVVDKVKYFDPAFHSITPEGFNSRLTFLHQCTRQGPTHSLSSGEITEESNSYNKWAGNLAFGRAPYCILRIGDFFNTKICITSLSIDYDNGGGIQWDLNPEGVGVQPMFANININFNFLGGQDINGPVERLQNAVTYNYYANASIYDRHADHDGKMFDAITGKHRTQAEIKKELEEYYKSQENIDEYEVGYGEEDGEQSIMSMWAEENGINSTHIESQTSSVLPTFRDLYNRNWNQANNQRVNGLFEKYGKK